MSAAGAADDCGVCLDTPEARRLTELVEDAGQAHLFADLDNVGRAGLLAQVQRLDAAYSGGLQAYVKNARRLLKASQRGDNPYDGSTPSVPSGESLSYGDGRFERLEVLGLQEAHASAFVLVAGGLGERLGFGGIKLALPVTVLTGWTYLEFFCRSLLALQSRQWPPRTADDSSEQPATAPIPLVIMSSGDTHEKTLALLEDNGYFGLLREQVHVLRQEKVACLSDGDARLACDPGIPGLIETKPHGHGDVHALLHASGLAEGFLQEGRKWLFFFQDTNALVFKVAAATLGLSAELGLDMNSVAVPRKPKDAMGGIVRLTHADGSSLTINVEYNQLDPLLRATIQTEGDVADATGHSPFPGNMNTLVLALPTYVETLQRTSGIIAEFVNPKYTDTSRTKFKSSTRLECMMQDIPMELPPKASVGFTMFDQWCCYSPVKNNPKAAREKFEASNHPQSATTGETDLFAANCRILRMAGAQVDPPQSAVFNGISVDLEARIVWSPQWASSYQAVRARLAPGGRFQISQRSTLILDGDVFIQDLVLDGALVVVARPRSSVHIAHLSVVNDGWSLEPTTAAEQDEVARIRGFHVVRYATRELVFSAGEHVVDE